MREFKLREGVSSEELRKDIQQQLDGKFPGVSISVEKDANGPPAGYPITIEITGKEYIELVETAKSMKDYLNQINIAGVEELKIDVSKNKPGVKINIDRKKAGELGVSTCLLYTSPSPRDQLTSRMPSSA